MTTCVIDFETRSAVDLPVHGAFRYAESLTTEIMCLAIAIDNSPVYLWIPDSFLSKINPKRLKYGLISESDMLRIIRDCDELVAHNIMFEYLIWTHCSRWSEPFPVSKMVDSMAQCAYHALPLALDQASLALNLDLQKDVRGQAVMRKLCKPRHPRKAEREADPNWATKLWWPEDTADLEALFNYGGRDVETERLVHQTLDPLPPFEQKIWAHDFEMNRRGVPIDLDSVRTIVTCLEDREREQLSRFAELTNGEVTGPRSYVALKDWVNKKTGLKLQSVNKNTVEDLLKIPLDKKVKEVLLIKSELAKSSTAKFKSMLKRTSSDGRLRGMLQYGGATTLRWAGRGVQLHNLPRDSYNPDNFADVVKLFSERDIPAIELFYDGPYYAASRCVRGALQATESTRFVCADFSSIEARALAYLAEDEGALDVFRKGQDPYKVAAANIYNVPYDQITKLQRQTGKVSELALGYAGGIGAYATMALGYGIDLETLPSYIMPAATPDELQGPYGAAGMAKMYLRNNPGMMSFEAAVACDVIKQKWRAARGRTCQLWKDAEESAYYAVEHPGEVATCGTVSYVVTGDFLKCHFPSGKSIHYYLPRLQNETTDWGSRACLTYMGMREVDGKTTRQWARISTYGGKLVENIVQSFCRDLLAEAMLRVEARGYPVVVHVHDEAVSEVRLEDANLNEFETIMSEIPPWAYGMPVEAEGWVGRRYRK